MKGGPLSLRISTETELAFCRTGLKASPKELYFKFFVRGSSRSLKRHNIN
jgi:hypothetical protein